jgi:hypothetical protein
MAAGIHIDRIDNLSSEEERGVMRSLTRKVRVVFDSLPDDIRNYNILSAALDHVSAEGMTPMSTLGNIGDSTKPFSPLVLVKRSTALVENTQNCVDVTLLYAHIIDGHNQYGISPPSGVLFAKGKTSIVDKTTNQFYPFGDRTKPPVLLEVGHQFPIGDPRAPSISADPRYPRFMLQGGEISTPFPQSNLNLEGIVKTLYPVALANSIIARINKFKWQGMEIGTWICSEVRYEINDPSIDTPDKPNYKMGFEFQYNVDTWDATIVFNDERSGKPVSGVVKATIADSNGVLRYQPIPKFVAGIFVGFDNQPAGMWKVPSLERLDFNNFFNAVFDGGVPI